ncbi:MAG: WD40 repeat domain-containing protein [Hyphomicrobiaceae bacterium]
MGCRHGSTPAHLREALSWINSVAFAPDGARLLSGSADKSLKLWDAATGRLIRTFEGHSDSVTSVAFSPDGLRIASGGFDGTTRLWDGRMAATPPPLGTVRPNTNHSSPVVRRQQVIRTCCSSSKELEHAWRPQRGCLSWPHHPPGPGLAHNDGVVDVCFDGGYLCHSGPRVGLQCSRYVQDVMSYTQSTFVPSPLQGNWTKIRFPSSIHKICDR